MDDDLIPISALQHYLYCPRQCALIHVEQQWAENRQTAEGRLLHQRADQPAIEVRKGIRTVTAMPLSSELLGIIGIADVVEFHTDGAGESPFPVEYKRGKPKSHRADEVQLCAQALCLEDMLGAQVTAGALFYGKLRRRTEVSFDSALRDLTRQTIVETRRLILSGTTPLAQYEARKCEDCSLLELCQPRWQQRGKDVAHWLRDQLDER